MAINDFSDADIREYLLGQADPEMTEQLDEHSFTDECAERIGTVEHDLIDEYLAGSLPTGETRPFESHYLSSPLRREKVEFARTLAKYAERSRPITAAGRDAGGSFWDGLRNWRMAFQFGMVVGGLLLV